MANLSKLKRGTLGAPPPIEEASPNLTAPETAPVAEAIVKPTPERPSTARKADRGEGRAQASRPKPIDEDHIDGRSLKRTNRTEQFATRVTAEFKKRIHAIARRDGRLLVEILEDALEAYEARRKS